MLSPLIQRVLVVLGTCGCSELLLQDAHACFFCVFGSCKKRQALCMQGLSSALQYTVGGNVAGSFHHRCACARYTRLILESTPAKCSFPLGLSTAFPHPLLLGLSAARQPSTISFGSPCHRALVPLAWRLNHMSEGLWALAAATGVQALDE